jgi:hypothetical protein
MHVQRVQPGNVLAYCFCEMMLGVFSDNALEWS